MKKIILFSLLITFMSCSSDDDNNDQQVCLETNISMIINGELQSFQAIGRGIDLRQNDYELSLNVYRSVNNPYKEQGITITLPYKKTGENIIEQFIYNEYANNVAFNGNFINGELQSNVLTNTNRCFYATFSGKLTDDNQEIIITEGKLSYKYEEPFD